MSTHRQDDAQIFRDILAEPGAYVAFEELCKARCDPERLTRNVLRVWWELKPKPRCPVIRYCSIVKRLKKLSDSESCFVDRVISVTVDKLEFADELQTVVGSFADSFDDLIRLENFIPRPKARKQRYPTVPMLVEHVKRLTRRPRYKQLVTLLNAASKIAGS